MRIFFDLDGTLIDSSERLYRLFCDLVPECKFSKEEYWNLKRNKINHQMILEKYFPNYDFEKFNEKWLNLIESEEYLKLDKLYPKTVETLEKLKNIELFVLTARQSEEALTEELKRLEIYKYFKEILVTKAVLTKEDLLKKELPKPEDYIVGDTGKDIQTGKIFNMKTVAVSHGFLNVKQLKLYNPDYIIESLTELPFYEQ